MSLGSLLNQSITVENPTGAKDLHAKRAYGTAKTLKARFQRTNKTIVSENREREPIDGIVFVGADAQVEIGAKVTYNNAKYRVLAIEDVVGGSGKRHHLELMVQLWSFAS